MFFLKNPEINHLNKIRRAVENEAVFNELTHLCDEIKPLLTDAKFAYTYAGCLLASHNKVDEAIQMFALNKQDTFCSIMLGYLEDYGVFEPAGKVFKSAVPYDIYVRTEFFQKHQAKTIQNIREIVKNIPPPESNSPVTIIDIGPGNGALIAKIVNEIAPIYNLDFVRLIFVDPFEDMLNKAEVHCKENIDIECEIIPVCCKIQDITKAQINLIQQNKPVWFINAALSVHHMPREAKVPMLKQLKSFSPNFILTEVNWNHDLPEKDSPELIYSVANNYGIFCKDIFKLPVSEKDRKLCLYLFPVSEAINIIKQERPDRIDFHTPIEEWEKIGSEAGYSVGDAVATYKWDNEPFAFVMGFDALAL
jgi:hypothetical protein